MRHTTLSSRDMCKTYLAVPLMVFAAMKGYFRYSYFVSYSWIKIVQEMQAMRTIAKHPALEYHYGSVVLHDTQTEIYFRNGCKLQATSVLSFPRGIRHDGFKPEFLVLDDRETRDTIRSAVITQNIARATQSDIISSLNNSRRRILEIANFVSVFGNAKAAYDATRPDRRMIIPLHTKDMEILWPERFTLTDKEAAGTIPRKISVESIKREYAEQTGGERTFREEYLCDPLSKEDRYHDIEVIRAHCSPKKKPISVITCRGLDLLIYKQFSKTKLYAVGSDLGEGLSLDGSVMTLLAFDSSSVEVVAEMASNTTKQDEFAFANMEAWNAYGAKPFVTWDALGGGAYGAVLHKEYSPDARLLFKRERMGKRGIEQTEDTGLLLNQVTTRALLAQQTRTALENGDLINHSPHIDKELEEFTNIDQNNPYRRPTFENSFGASHFDRLWSLRFGFYGIEQARAALTATAKTPNPTLSESGFYNRPTAGEASNPYRQEKG